MAQDSRPRGPETLEPFMSLNEDIGVDCGLARNPPRRLANDEEIVAESVHGEALVTKRHDPGRKISGVVLTIPLDDARQYWINQTSADFLRFKGQMLADGGGTKDTAKFVQDGQNEMLADGCWVELVTEYCQAIKDGQYLSPTGDTVSCVKR
jgi:hypothetical protein